MMAAAKMRAESSSSSSDDEVLKRCREAVWETDLTKDVDKVKGSKRLVVSKHDHDGNELQVTEGFQTHVAKKLSHFLDSHISELPFETSSVVKPTTSGDEEAFRLFSTSVPGQKVEDPPAPVRRRPVPSSSDSDSEMELRFKEAALSYEDLVPQASLPDQHTCPTEEPVNTEVVKKKKKKKKKKMSEGEEETHVGHEQDSLRASQNSHNNNVHSEQEQTDIKRKKKKKRQKTDKVV
ncbi:protein CUSTOS [Synchiropus splendidus]|uniref:protein CUSTOS n=1 Tax=Synchiropus splendidus TaxID=270530 RepID=UPI00237E5193|nr:protein CUSTOS [Synchiropus splendidus]